MKKLISIMIAIVSIFLLAGCGSNSTTQEQYLRIHIRANSNSRIDQNIKYTIKFTKLLHFDIILFKNLRAKMEPTPNVP